jgi:hypothetical protein
MLFLAIDAVRGNRIGNHSDPFLGIPSRRDALPTVTLLRIGLEAPVDLRHHGDVPMAELSGDQLEGSASPGHPDRPVMAGVVQPVAGEPKRPQAVAVGVPHHPSVYPAEHALTGQYSAQVSLHKGPCPVSHPCQAVAGPSLGAPRTDLARCRIDVAVYKGPESR